MTAKRPRKAPAKAGARKVGGVEVYRDLSQEEALEKRIPLASIMASLSKEQSAALCKGEAVVTEAGTLFPLVVRLPGAEKPMATAVLSRVTQSILDERQAAEDRFKLNLSELLLATEEAAPEALPAIKELLESYLAYNDATNNLLNTVVSDFNNMYASFATIPALTIRAQRGSAATKRHLQSDAGRAKAAALELWPEAKRNGWTARRMHTELAHRKHNVAEGTVAKWMTKFRKIDAASKS